MQKDTTSPFTPGIPVPVEFFVGRQDELRLLARKAGTTAKGRIQVAFLVGERGIGKSSLAAYVRLIAEKEHQLIGIHTFLGGAHTLEEMVRRVFDRLLKGTIGAPWHGKVKQFFGDRIRQVDLFGISVDFVASSQDLNRLAFDFVPALRNLLNQLDGEKDGVFLILDDINGLASSPVFANWLKSLIDEIATSQEPFPIFILLVGLEERRQELIRVQPSLARVFDLVEIRAWSDEETRHFYENALERVGVAITEDALTFLVSMTGGLPVIAHEIGDAAFNLLEGEILDIEVATAAVLTAAEVIGRKHIQAQVMSAIRSERYRSILRKLPHIGERLDRGDVLNQLSDEECKVFDNFLRRMQTLDVVRRDPDRGAGAYQFTNRIYHLYFLIEATRVKNSARGR